MTAPASHRARAYHTVRTAHLERSLDLAPADLIYGQRRYDFDGELAASVAARARLEQAGDLRSAWLLCRRRYEVIEINEPIAIETVRRTAAALLAVRIADRLRRRRTTVVTYAIGNVPVRRLPVPGGKARLGRLLDTTLAPLVWRECDRVVFGTAAAENAYRESFGAPAQRTSTEVIPALPTVCSCVVHSSTSERDGVRLLFLGDLSSRKGFDHVLRAWATVREQVRRSQLVIVGRGAMVEAARRLAAEDVRVDFIEDPPRTTVHEQLRLADVLVLPSQPSASWREQVGLPLVEGLAHGCTLVTTDETGIAGWLEAHGHHVAPAADTEADLPRLLVAALSHPMDPTQVVATLPRRDGRLAADAWMFQPATG